MLLLLLCTVLLWATARAQSGDVDVDAAPTVSCTSHISLYEGSNLSCRLLSRDYSLHDDEDEEGDAIENITACCCALGKRMRQCVEARGQTLSSMVLNPVSLITVTVLTKRGRRVEEQFDLKKIIKPKSPRVFNVTQSQDRALVRVQVPYQDDYLNENNMYFQLQLWSESTTQTQNMSSGSMNIGWNHLHRGTTFHVRVRALPWNFFQGTWSEWSQPLTFHTPPGDAAENLSFLWSLVYVAAVFLTVLVLWKHKLLRNMWPSVPHPKRTLMQICGPNSGLLLLHIPEEITSLNIDARVSQSDAPPCRETGTNEPSSCSTQSTDSSTVSSTDSSTNSSIVTATDSSSAGTEELELLSQSSASEEPQDAPREGLSTNAPETAPPDEPEHSYVTMSSFYRIKSSGTEDRTAPISLIET